MGESAKAVLGALSIAAVLVGLGAGLGAACTEEGHRARSERELLRTQAACTECDRGEARVIDGRVVCVSDPRGEK